MAGSEPAVKPGSRYGDLLPRILVGIALIALRSHGRDVPIPFGPYLAAAGVIALFFGEALNRVYLGLF